MADPNLRQEAKEWLQQLYVGPTDPSFDKPNGEAFYQFVASEVGKLDEAFKQAFFEAIGDWIDPTDHRNFTRAQCLITEFRLTQHLDRLRELLANSELGRLEWDVGTKTAVKFTIETLVDPWYRRPLEKGRPAYKHKTIRHDDLIAKLGVTKKTGVWSSSIYVSFESTIPDIAADTLTYNGVDGTVLVIDLNEQGKVLGIELF